MPEPVLGPATRQAVESAGRTSMREKQRPHQANLPRDTFSKRLLSTESHQGPGGSGQVGATAETTSNTVPKGF